MKKTITRAFKFVLVILPFALLAGICTAYYEIQTGMLAEALKTMSSFTLIVMVVSQTMIYAVVCGFFGYLLADKTGLLKRFSIENPAFKVSMLYGAACGAVLFGSDYLLFRFLIPQVADYYLAYPFSLTYLGSEIFYGGMIEELMLRWLCMTLLVFLLWKLCARKKKKEEIPVWIFVISNIAVAVLFAAGHIPATILLFGELNAVILIRCFFLNGGVGLVCGRVYRKYGIQYAMIVHAITHVACDILLFMVMKVFA